jgi:uncharacterized membrane protein
MLQGFFALFGATGRHLPALAVVSILLAWHIARKDCWSISLRTLLGMAAESVALGVPLIVFGLGVVTLATLELSIREHLAGYRSHSALLAAIGAMLVAVPLAAFVRPDKGIVLIVAAVVFLLVFQLMRELFKRRSGGMSWRA